MSACPISPAHPAMAIRKRFSALSPSIFNLFVYLLPLTTCYFPRKKLLIQRLQRRKQPAAFLEIAPDGFYLFAVGAVLCGVFAADGLAFRGFTRRPFAATV
jgi:hypothetical protein